MKRFIALSLLAASCAEGPLRPEMNHGKGSAGSDGTGEVGTDNVMPKDNTGAGPDGVYVPSPVPGNGTPSNEIKILEPGSSNSARYEAEDSFTAGTAKLSSSQNGFTGKGYMEALAAPSDKLVFTVQSASLARTSLDITYSATAAKKVTIIINGLKVSTITLASTGASFKVVSNEIDLRAGLNTITLLNEDSTGAAVLIDAVEIKNAGLRANRGATVPFLVYEAEDGQTNGSVVGPSREMHKLPSAASGRKAITLDATGKFVEWKTKAEANGLVIRYSMPDSQDGQGLKGSLSIYVDGKKIKSVELTSKYAWVYGGYPFTNKPEEGKPHRFFDDSHFLLEKIPSGSTIRLQKDASDSTPSYTIDLIELELVAAPYTKPMDALSVVDFGAKASDGIDDTDAIKKALEAAKKQSKTLWFPEGQFQTKERFNVDHVTIRGAGPWHSAILGLDKKGGFHGTGDAFQIYDIAILGDNSVRDDGGADAGIDGFLGKGSFVQNVWFEHTKVGMWTEDPTEGLYVVGCRIRNTFADGVNFYSGTKNSAVEHTHIRGTGDDGMALWPERASGEYNRYRFNTIMLPDLANGIAIYGGTSNAIQDNLITDTQEASAGIAISTRFTAVDFAGTTLVERNTITRAGGWERNWMTSFGALWVFADLKDITADIQIRDLDIIDANYQGILLSNDRTISNMKFERVNIKGAATLGLEVRAKGSISVSDFKIESAKEGIQKLPNAGFEIKGDAGN